MKFLNHFYAKIVHLATRVQNKIELETPKYEKQLLSSSLRRYLPNS